MPATATYGPTAAPASGPPSALSGKPTEATIDQVNIWMRGQPWYQAYMRSIGQDPGHPTLTENQSTAVKRLAQANGVVVDEGNIELDDHGNFNPIGHKLRNTLIVIGAAAATIATMGAAGAFSGAGGASAGAAGGVESGVTAGLGSAALPGAGTALSGAAAAGGGAAAAGAGAAFDAAGNFIGPSTISTIGGGGGATYGAAAGSGLTGDFLKYGLPAAGGLASGLIQANASGKASDAQQALLQEALDYEKQQDALNRTIAADKVKLEAGRYADYSGNVAPYLATGSAAAGRASSLLGLPAGSAPSGGGSAQSQAVPVTPDITAKLTDYYKSIGLTPTGPGTGPTDIAYMAGKVAETGGWTPNNESYWLGPNGRINQELTKAGVSFGQPSATSAPAPAQQTTQPQARTTDPSATVSLRAPDGSVKQVPADQADHYLSLGATRVA